MRLPGTLKELYKQLKDAPAPVQRIEIPTKDGPIVLEFAVAPPVVSIPRPARPTEKPEERSDAPRRVRDIDLIRKPVEPMTYDPPEDKPS